MVVAMFTGLVETVGTLSARTAQGGGARLSVRAEGSWLEHEGLVLGESVAVEGVCLTVDHITKGGFDADASEETLSKTTLGRVRVGGRVNLERAVKLGARMGGHIVSGHVDGVGRVIERAPIGRAERVVFGAPSALLPMIAPKGSVCVSGVSLTVNEVTSSGFSVALVPHTLARTSLEGLAAGDEVNLEVDVLMRYVARLLAAGGAAAGASEGEQGRGASDAAWVERLTRGGYM
jgi:riboflavin synthase